MLWGVGRQLKINLFAVVELEVGGWVVVGGPSDFIVNQSPNLWIFGF